MLDKTTSTYSQTAEHQIHYWELSNYNGGLLIGRWFQLDGLTEEEHKAEVNDWLETLTEESGELCEEIIVGDAEGVPRNYLGEWRISDEFFEFMEAADKHSLEVVQAAAECGIPMDKIDDSYQGEFNSDTDFAEDYADNIGLLNEVPENLQTYFNWESYARDLMMDYVEDNGHYFCRNY